MRTITSQRHFPYNCLGLTDEDNSVSRTDNFVNVNVFNTVASARVLSYRWVLHYFSTIPVGGSKIVTFYKRSIFQVEQLRDTLILCISHCSESDSVSSRVFYSAVSTARRRFLFLMTSKRNKRKRSKVDNCTVHEVNPVSNKKIMFILKIL